MMSKEKSSALIRIKDASEFLDSAKDNLDKNRFKSVILDCGDAIIAANDALTIYVLGEMASRDHQEAIKLHKKVGVKINENRVDILQNLLNIRHQKGYRAIVVSKSLAEETLKDATKFVKWVKEKIMF